MKRLTEPNKEYKSGFLLKLWEYENTGFQPNEIIPKEGSAAAKEKHKVELIRTETDGKNGFWTVVFDGEYMKLQEFATMVKISHSTICGWVQKGMLEVNLRKRGII